MNEDRLNELARRLGTNAAQRLDVEATARKVVQRLREPAPRATWIQQTWMRIAATVVILVGGAVALRQVRIGGDSPEHVAHFVADDLNDLSPDQLREVLSSFDVIVTTDTVTVPETNGDLRELDAQQLRAVLRSLEG